MNTEVVDFAHIETTMAHAEWQRLLTHIREVGFAHPDALARLRWRMTNNQRAILGGELALRPRGNYSTATAKKALPPTRNEVQDTLGISVGSMDRAKALVRHGLPELIDICAAGLVTLSTAAIVARLDPVAQQEFIKLVKEGEHPRTVLKKLRASGVAGPPVMSMNKARYRYVQESAFRVLADSFDGLNMVLARAEGLDPALTPAQAAAWRADLSRRARCFRQLLTLLAARSEANDQHQGAKQLGAHPTQVHHNKNRTRSSHRRPRRPKTP